MTTGLRNGDVVPDLRAGIRLLARLARVAEQACQTTGISLPQYRLLVTISDQSQRASELATLVGVTRPTLTSLVDGLEQAGMLRRAPVPSDRRGIELVLTETGRAAVARAEDALMQRVSQLFDRDMATLVNGVLAALGDALDRSAGAPPGGE